MQSELLALRIHKHPMMPWNALRRGDCCETYDPISDGFYCKECDFFFHKKCCIFESIEHLSHHRHPLKLTKQKRGKWCGSHTLRLGEWKSEEEWCKLCGRRTGNLCYRCEICDFAVDLFCAKHPPPQKLDSPLEEVHYLYPKKERIEFQCSAKCGKKSYGFPYACEECETFFHMDCVWRPLENYPPEVNSPYHSSQHSLYKLIGPTPDYSDGKCRLCGKGNTYDLVFYHCPPCNFNLCFGCLSNPPPKSLLDVKAHDHQLTLLPRLDSFTCNACGLKGDRSPYACFDCGFMIHQSCLALPRVINVNRHDHRVSRTSVLGAVNSVCGVCRKKVNWIYGGYSCHKCPGYVVHSKCATRKDVWNGKELEDVPEVTEDTRPYVVIDANTIQHFSHKEHFLRLINCNGLLYEGNRWCYACSHPVGLQSFYDCMDCDFLLHQNCAECPTKRWHVLHNDRLTLLPTERKDYEWCNACRRLFNGFVYSDDERKSNFDLCCGSISEPFVHPSHPHPLYYVQPELYEERCDGCQKDNENLLRCIEEDCEGFKLGFECATLPQVVKHRVDDHPLSLCYGEKASGKYWCDICEKETNPERWFYTCKDQRASLHTECVFGSLSGFLPRSTIYSWDSVYEVVLNSSVTRPFCYTCRSRCMSPIILKLVEKGGTKILGGTYRCSEYCN